MVVVVGIAVLLLAVSSSCRAAQEGPDSADVRQIAVGGGPGSVAVVDVNADQRPDLVVANETGNSVSVLLGDGAGGFQEAAGSPYPAGPNPNDIAAGDFNGDAVIDLAFPNHETDHVTVLLGDGRGGFAPSPGSPVAVQSNPHPHGLASGDFDGDGNLDLVVESFETDQLELLRGDGEGNLLAPGSMIAVGPTPYQKVRSGDIDLDGRPDLVTTNRGNATITVLLSDGRGEWTEASGSPFTVPESPFAVAIGNVDGEGGLDLVLAHYSGSINDPRADAVSVWLGDGEGSFRAAPGSPHAGAGAPLSVAIGDVNGDGRGDIAVANYGAGSVTLLLSSPAGLTEADGSPIAVGDRPAGVSLADLDGDSREDLIVANSGDDTVSVLLSRW